MRKFLSGAILCVALAPLPGVSATPAPAGTPPPEIEHTYTRPVCSALKTVVAPAIGMLQQNDATIAATPNIFKAYVAGQSNGSGPQQSLAVLRLENTVTPLSNNILAIQKLLANADIFPPNPQTDDDRRKLQLKQQLEESLAQQQAALDIINGFVTTQQMGALQHAGEGYIRAFAQPDQGSRKSDALAPLLGPSADPTKPQPFDDVLINAGLPTNPYEMDLTKIPGLTLGYNPVGKLKEGVEYTQTQGKEKEATLAKTVIETVKLCSPAR